MYVSVRISGIPASVKVDHYKKVKHWSGPASLCDSDLDYHGFEEIEYTICDSRGRPAKWLEKKASKEDDENIKISISEAFKRLDEVD